MRRKSLFVLIAVLASLIASAPAVLAQTDCKTVVPPSPWGPNDQTGATNRVTPAVTKAAAAEIQEGKVIVMAYPLTDGIPLFGTRFTKTILTATTSSRTWRTPGSARATWGRTWTASGTSAARTATSTRPRWESLSPRTI